MSIPTLFWASCFVPSTSPGGSCAHVTDGKGPFWNVSAWEAGWMWNTQATLWFGKEAPEELPAPGASASSWQLVEEGGRRRQGEACWEGKQPAAAKQHVTVSRLLHRHRDISAVSWLAERLLWVCCVSWVPAVATIPSFLSKNWQDFSQSCQFCDTLNFYTFQWTGLENSSMQTYLDTRTF